MKKALASILAALALGSTATAVAPPVLPFDQVRPGMKGIGKTVFSGTEVREFEVEILGTLPNVGPGRNLILGRCSGGPLATTGVLAGMSGSPVFVDGKLAGAVAFSWGFSKEAIAGITPIEEMLSAAARLDAPAARSTGGKGGPSGSIDRLRFPESLESAFPEALLAFLPPPSEPAPISVPVSLSGIGAEGFRKIEPWLSRAGFLPMQGSGAGAAPSPSPDLVPGSAIGLKLARGDIDITATGTVTWVDGDRVLAFGHPLYGLGPVDFPLTGARSEALIPSLQQSARIAVPLSEIGAFRQDLSSGIFGRLGATPRMIPVRVQLLSREGTSESFAFDVASDPLLAPLLLYAGLNGILASRERTLGDVTIRVRQGSVVRLENSDDIALDNLWVGPEAPFYATGIPAYVLHLLLNNEWSPPAVSGVNLILEYDAEPRSGRIRRVTLDRYHARPGDTVEATIVVAPYRGADRVVRREIAIPPETPPGRLLFFVGDAGSLNRVGDEGEDLVPRDLDQLVRRINTLRRNDRIHVLGVREDAGILMGGERFPSLPPSALSLLTRPRSQGNVAVAQRRAILESEIPVEFAVSGFARVPVEVEGR